MAALQLCERPIVLFDFDGTVADTGRAVMTSTRKTLAARGFSEAQMGDLRRMIGTPLWKSFHDFYGFTREESLVVADEYRAFFDELGPEEYPVFDGIPELLDGLAARGKRIAVATSRMEAKCIDMVHELGLSQFEAVVGMNPPQGRETKADSVRDALAALLLAGILMVMGAYRIFSYLCENAQMDAVTFLLGGACALLAVGGFLLARASFRRLKELHLGQ